MPVEASDIVQRAMDKGDSSYTGCEEESAGSDDGVRKKTVPTRAASLSNQIHSTQEDHAWKPWKSGTTIDSRLQTRPEKQSAFFRRRHNPALENVRTSLSLQVYIPDAKQDEAVPDLMSSM